VPKKPNKVIPNQEPVMTAPDLTTYRAVHTGLRTAPHRLEAAVRELDPADTGRVKALTQYWKGYSGEVLAHHRVEDDHMFPALIEKIPTAAALLERTDVDHHVLDELMAACTDRVSVLGSASPADLDALAADLAALGRHMAEHLDFEDAEILPLFETRFTGEEYQALDEAAVKSLGIGAQAAFTVPFILGTVPAAERAALIKGAPVPLRVLYRLTRARHARLSARAFGPVSPAEVAA
jgi:hemerythrin-like domain-containing protein